MIILKSLNSSEIPDVRSDAMLTGKLSASSLDTRCISSPDLRGGFLPLLVTHFRSTEHLCMDISRLRNVHKGSTQMP